MTPLLQFKSKSNATMPSKLWPLSYYWYRLRWWWCEHFNWTPSVPLHLDLELTNQCNLACTMCRHGINPDSNQGQMKTALAMEVINQAAAMGIYSIKFQFRGESALHKDLEKLITYSKNKGIRHTQLNTNLVAFNKQRLIQLCQSGLDRLIISIDGATRKTYEEIRVGSKWSRLVYLLGVVQLQAIKPIIRIQMVHQNSNHHEINDFIDKFSPLCHELHVKPVRSNNKGTKRRSCAQPRQRIVVGWNGDIFGCCNAWYNESLVGRIQQGPEFNDYPDKPITTKPFSLKAQWAGLQLYDLRLKARNPGQHQPCKSCLVKGSYK